MSENNWQSRTEAMIGTDAAETLRNSFVAVFGVGGVGSYTVEALARAGVGHITLYDSDDVDVTNINRQLIALQSTVGKAKVEVAAARIKDINPDCEVTTYKTFILPEKMNNINFKAFNYVVDAIDTVSAKIAIITECEKAGTPVISCMGAGNKLDPTRFEVADIYKTSVCPLAKVMRKELKAHGVKSCKVVFSKEEPVSTELNRTPASISFVPSVAGLILAGEVIKDLTSIR